MAKDRMENLEDAISTRLGRSGALLERMGVTHESFFRTVIHALVTSQTRVKPGRKSLADCTPDSVDLALIKCLNAGLMPDGEEVLLKPRTSGKGKEATTECSVELGIVGKLKQAYKASPGICHPRTRGKDARGFRLAPCGLSFPRSQEGRKCVPARHALYLPPPAGIIVRLPTSMPDRKRGPARGPGGDGSTDHPCAGHDGGHTGGRPRH